jgi:hypothetical protein
MIAHPTNQMRERKLKMSEKTVKVRLLEGRPGQFHNDGAGNEIWDVRRGQVVTLPESLAKRYRANGLVTADLKSPVEELPRAHAVTKETESLAEWARQETLRGIPAEIRHRVPGCAEFEAAQAPRREAAARRWRQRQPVNGGWIGT